MRTLSPDRRATSFVVASSAGSARTALAPPTPAYPTAAAGAAAGAAARSAPTRARPSAPPAAGRRTPPDDVPRARQFYTTVFDWHFEPWGPPGFYLIATGHEKVGSHSGGLQERRELVAGHKMIGFECTITVENIDQAIRAIEANGGTIVAPKFHIPTVGTCGYFQDPEGNVVGICQREPRK